MSDSRVCSKKDQQASFGPNAANHDGNRLTPRCASHSCRGGCPRGHISVRGLPHGPDGSSAHVEAARCTLHGTEIRNRCATPRTRSKKPMRCCTAPAHSGSRHRSESWGFAPAAWCCGQLTGDGRRTPTAEPPEPATVPGLLRAWGCCPLHGVHSYRQLPPRPPR